jgi:small subunit ribosomal protein S14
MAKKSWVVRASRPAKFEVRNVYRCKQCGRSRSYMRKFGLCRICFREMASQGRLPGVTKSSW